MVRSETHYVVVDIPDEEVTYIGFSWELEGEWLQAAIEEVYSDICDRNGWVLIWDFQAVGKLVVNPGDIERFAETVRRKVSPHCKPEEVLLVTSDLLISALARLYQHLSRKHKHPVRLMGSVSDAVVHIGARGLQETIREKVRPKLKKFSS